MPIADAPYWTMDARAKAARDEVAPAQRVFLGQLMDQLAAEGVDPNDVMSFATEVLAAQVNMLVARAKQRREVELGRQGLGDDGYTTLIVSDIFNRAQLRRLRGDERV